MRKIVLLCIFVQPYLGSINLAINFHSTLARLFVTSHVIRDPTPRSVTDIYHINQNLSTASQQSHHPIPSKQHRYKTYAFRLFNWKNEKRKDTNSTRFPSGSLQYTLLNFPLAPVLSTIPSSLFSPDRSTMWTPAAMRFCRTWWMGVVVRKQRSALPGLTFVALGSNSLGCVLLAENWE